LKITTQENIGKLKSLIDNAKNILITTHVNADGDAIGSSMALALVLKKTGKEVMIITPNDYPGFLHWLPGQELINVDMKNPGKTKLWAEKADIIFCVDYNEPKRLKKAEAEIIKSKAIKVLIDHHPFPADFTDLKISVTKLGSTAELLYYLIHQLGLQHLIDKDVAECLFTGIMTDTGCFSYSCSYPQVFNVTAELLKHGINKDLIYSNVYENFSESRMKLMGYCLNEKMVVLPEYNTAYISLTEKELQQYNHLPGDTEGFVNIPFSIKNIRFTALFMEKRDYIKISFRSRGNFNVNQFSSRYFNGGGHLNAAGGEVKQSMEDTLRQFVKLLPEFRKQLT